MSLKFVLKKCNNVLFFFVLNFHLQDIYSLQNKKGHKKSCFQNLVFYNFSKGQKIILNTL